MSAKADEMPLKQVEVFAYSQEFKAFPHSKL